MNEWPHLYIQNVRCEDLPHSSEWDETYFIDHRSEQGQEDIFYPWKLVNLKSLIVFQNPVAIK